MLWSNEPVAVSRYYGGVTALVSSIAVAYYYCYLTVSRV